MDVRYYMAAGAVLLALLLGSMGATAQSITSKSDSIGYTHYSGNTKSGERVVGLSKRNSIGQVMSDWSVGNKRSHCLTTTNSIGVTRTNCH